MSKQYYYLDGKDQKGPLSIEKLNDVGIKPDSLVWSDDMENWKPAKEVSELINIIKKLPPPPPIIDNYQKPILTSEKEFQTIKKLIVEDSNVKLWTTFKIFFAIMFLMGIVGLVGYSYVNSKKNSLKKEMLDKINIIFDSKTVILDGQNTEVQGTRTETNYTKDSKSKNKSQLKFLLDWWEEEGLYTIFNCSSGGFTIKKLTRLSEESFDLESYHSSDIGFTSPPSSTGITSTTYDEYGEHNKYGTIPNYRRDAQYSYNDAFNFFTAENKSGYYSPGKLIDIENFPSIRNEYFYINNCAPKQYYAGSKNSIEWWSQDSHSHYIFNDDERVYYSVRGKHYELTLDDGRYKKDLITIIGISFGIITLL